MGHPLKSNNYNNLTRIKINSISILLAKYPNRFSPKFFQETGRHYHLAQILTMECLIFGSNLFRMRSFFVYLNLN